MNFKLSKEHKNVKKMRKRYDGWISVEYLLPEKEWETYITSHKDGSVQIHSYYEGEFVLNWDTDKPNSKVIAWQPLPKPYQLDKEI